LTLLLQRPAGQHFARVSAMARRFNCVEGDETASDRYSRLDY
jgi:hypothetical protein